MMRWPGQRRLETRIAELEDRATESTAYTDALLAAITARAAGDKSAIPSATGALEACAGFIGRAFAAAEVDARPGVAELLDPACLGMIGRALLRRGEIVLLIRADMGGVQLLPAETHDVHGGSDPRSWRYRVNVAGPTMIATYQDVAAEDVVHVRYAFDPERPWRGYSPLYVAQLAGRLSANTVAALADESSSPRGTILTVPVDGNDPTVASLKSDIAGMRGEVHLLQGGDWDAEGSGASVGAGNLRIGPSPTAPLVELMMVATREVYAACGLNPAIFETGTGTAGREAYRQALFGVIAPLGRLVETELRAKLEDESLTLGWTELRASDIVGRARAFQSMTASGMEPAKAAALSGLMIDDA